MNQRSVSDAKGETTTTLPTWKLNLENNWGLFINGDHKLPVIPDKETRQKTQALSKKSTDSDFYFSKQRNLGKGMTIWTPKGYGIIQLIDKPAKKINVKVQGVIHEFNEDETLTDIPLRIVMFSGTTSSDEVLHFPLNLSFDELNQRYEASLRGEYRTKLFYRGKEITDEKKSIEELQIAPFSKVLAIGSLKKIYSVSRFANVAEGWGLGHSAIDSISFTASRDTQIIGFGVYPTEPDSVIVCSLYSGYSTGVMLWKGEMRVLPSQDNATRKKPEQVLFGKPILLKLGEKFTLSMTCMSEANCYYGDNGKDTSEGEDGTVFTFERDSGNEDQNNGTEVFSGMFPTIFYYG